METDRPRPTPVNHQPETAAGTYPTHDLQLAGRLSGRLHIRLVYVSLRKQEKLAAGGRASPPMRHRWGRPVTSSTCRRHPHYNQSLLTNKAATQSSDYSWQPPRASCKQASHRYCPASRTVSSLICRPLHFHLLFSAEIQGPERAGAGNLHYDSYPAGAWRHFEHFRSDNRPSQHAPGALLRHALRGTSPIDFSTQNDYSLTRSDRQIGHTHGTKARSQIEGSIAFYAGLFKETAKLDWPRVRTTALEFEPVIRRKWPAYLEEMRGIAEGAGVELADVLALNVRTEIAFGLFTDGCTMLAWHSKQPGGSAFIAQNWDVSAARVAAKC